MNLKRSHIGIFYIYICPKNLNQIYLSKVEYLKRKKY